MQKAVFISRDGILNEYAHLGRKLVPPRNMEEFKLITSAKPLIAKLVKAGFSIVAITHQPSVSHGDLARNDLDRMHAVIRRYFTSVIDILSCLHIEDDSCNCCSPEPGLLKEAASRFKINLVQSFVISNRWQDSMAAWNANCTSIQIRSYFNGKIAHNHLVDDFDSAVDKVLTLDRKTA